MKKLNSTTAILLDLDGVILDLKYDIKFWQAWLPETLAAQSKKSIEILKEDLSLLMKNQQATLKWYDLNYWDELLDVDCLQIIKSQKEKCSFLDGSLEALKRLSKLPNPKFILTNGDPRLFEYKAESEKFLQFFDSYLCSMEVGYAKEQKEFWSLASLNLEVDLKNSILIDDNLKVVKVAINAGVGKVYWINPGRHKILSNGIETYPSLSALVDAII
jgi:putative hydrolase of the HAD superfamily